MKLISSKKELILIRKGKSDFNKGTAISALSEDNKGLKMDDSVLRKTLEETEKVRLTLNEVFSGNEDEKQSSTAPVPAEENSKLPEKYRHFMHLLLKKNTWKKKEFHQRALDNDLIPGKSIEVINLWTEKNYGDFLICEDGDYVIQHNILEVTL